MGYDPVMDEVIVELNFGFKPVYCRARSVAS